METIHPVENEKPSNRLRLNGESDKLFHGKNYPQPFAFTEEVAAVFDDMVLRSIPYYEQSINILCEWVARHFVAGTRIYDLGCSTGTTIGAMIDRLDRADMEIVAVDSSAPMLEMAQQKLSHLKHKAQIHLICEDICKLAIGEASVVVMNYTLQFVPVEDRMQVLRGIHHGLEDGGLLFLSEKIRSESAYIGDTKASIYEDFKFANGYSTSEISRKKAALERVLVPFSLSEHLEYLRAAGFSAAEPVFLWNNFVSIVAIK